MKLQRPQLPSTDDKFGADLVFKLRSILSSVIDQVNNLTEGKVSAVHAATDSAPTTGTYQVGDFIRKKTPVEAGTAGSKYVVIGYLCVAAGTPGTWVEARCTTGH